MNKKETQLLALIQQNPYISQQELADQLDLSRSAVAGYISNLMKDGVILGKAYVLNKLPTVLCIGGANLDRKLHVKGAFQWEDSNPVFGTESYGGVARNIAENLAKLQVETALFTTIGMESSGQEMLRSLKNVDTSASIHVAGRNTGTYTAVLNEQNELMFALAEMDIYDTLTLAMVKQHQHKLRQASIIVMDTNFSKEVLEEVVKQKQANQQLVIVPVSAKKMDRLPDSLHGITTMILNRTELQTISEGNSLEEHAYHLREQGVENVIVTLGREGVAYFSANESGTLEAIEVDVVDVTGAGDAFSSGVVFEMLRQSSLEAACRAGLMVASETLKTDTTVADHITRELLEGVEE
ncbi:winged helix-turn-helix transcriptional regulator [Paenalkalicoccus suaedae]|uniref:Winged helix-turn-helix transcriptional regulator n=1 Tax=Paenalkalicoccus suaedae TaxID=2592382 RepID=A0A859FD75_9BACI|nr:carbohydrate kinase [Paenalkalicoccus suaedae]QKS70702.1 winged helix-turn-helix transcriptional regulator [Paenalkalicoccus suaedae]